MDSEIIYISEDQNEIRLADGTVLETAPRDLESLCEKCFFFLRDKCDPNAHPCLAQFRKDNLDRIYITKTHAK